MEPLNAKNPFLTYEAKLYKQFQDLPGIPEVYWFGVEGDFTVLVM